MVTSNETRADIYASLAKGSSTAASMKREKTIYWATTGIVCAVMTFSIVKFTFDDHFPTFPFGHGTEGAFAHLGLPTYFKVELTIAKMLGVLALLIPRIPVKVKEFAYVGFAITLVSASIAHGASGDASISVLFILDPLIFLGVLTVSYLYFGKVLARKGRV